MFGKLMSVSDELMWRYFDLLSFRNTAEIDALRKQAVDGNPRDVKFLLAGELVGRFHGDAAAARAKEAFIRAVSQGGIPDEVDEVSVAADGGRLGIAHLLRQAGLVASNGEAFRMIKQGAVRIDGERVEDRALEIEAGTTHVYQVGKRKFARVTLV
jgi:tyrosyl-tRNA synthetase